MPAGSERRSPITLLTDFGTSDHYVAAMKGVMLGVCPEAQLVDIAHDVGAYRISEAAYILAQACYCFPPGTVHLVVVDPGVGSARRPIVARAGGHYFVAPDNGVLTMAFEKADRGPEVFEISATRFFRQPVSQTFHGRDIFAPAAAHLASGIAISEFGPRTEDYVRLHSNAPEQCGPDRWSSIVLRVDRFGNIVTGFDWESFRWITERPFGLMVGNIHVNRWVNNYAEAEPGELFAIQGSAGYLEISSNRANAAQIAGVSTGSRIDLAGG